MSLNEMPLYAADVEIENFLSTRFRHHVFGSEEVRVRRNLAPWVKTAFDWAMRAANGRQTTPDELDTVHASLETADLAFMPLIVANEANLAAGAGELQRLRADVVSLSEAGEVLRAGAAGLTSEVTARDAKISVLNQRLSERDLELSRLRDALTARDTSITVLNQTLAEREAKIVALDQALAERDCELGGLRDELTKRDASIVGLQSAISALRASTSWRSTAPLRFMKRMVGRFRYGAIGYPLMLCWRALRTRSRAPLRDWRAARTIANSGFLDREWYLRMNPDVAACGVDPVRHYVAFGAREGRDPSAWLSTRDYLSHNPDVAIAGVNPLSHFILYGAPEGRVANSSSKPCTPLQLTSRARGSWRSGMNIASALGLFREAIRLAGGIAPLALKSWRVLREEGLGGLRSRLYSRGLLAAKQLSRSLPYTVQVLLRTGFYETVSRLTPRSSLAQQYTDFKRATTYTSPLIKITDRSSQDSRPEDALISATREFQGNGTDIFIFPIIDWHFRIQRPQHIAKRLARRGYRVIYFSTTFLPSGGPAYRLIDTPAEGVFLCQLSCPDPHPVIYSTLPNHKQQAWLAEAIRHLQEKIGARPTVALLHLAFWRSIAATIPGAALIYDCMDYHGGFSNSSTDLQSEEQILIEQADVVVTSSQALNDLVGRTVPNILIRNAAEVEFFAALPKETVIRSSRATVGYFGTIAEWFDSDLIAAAAAAFPHWDFVLIGSYARADMRKVTRLSNVTLLGERPYDELPGYLQLFDVCIIPFKLNDLTLYTNPVKIYEYLSAGKPVVATPLPELELLEDGLVHIAGTKEAFFEKLSIAVSECNDLEKANRRKYWAAQQTWKNRADKFEQAILSCFPKTSVVVLCHNNLEFTKSCLSSLDKFTLYPNWELILVDNASHDGTASYLEDYAATRSWARVIISSENRGFSGGNNMGLREASGDYLVILNNDTVVTQGWLAGLIRNLRRNPSLGLVGPVTNNIGNQARIDIAYQNIDEMADKARSYTVSRHGNLLHVDNLGFFCVAFPRKIYEQVGPLDEAFRIGFFEDDDYCKRVQLAGYEIAIAEDVFIHHHLSASFDSLGQERKQTIFEENRRVYEAKWGPWRPHRHRSR